MSRKYTLNVKFDSPYDLASALIAIGILVPEDEFYETTAGADASRLARMMFDACQWNNHIGFCRPAIMPGSVAESGDEKEWREAVRFLRAAADELERYLDSESQS